eukprot:TRINITY_DN22828_c0_g2_i6.p2 TRINITY_DN22828_c0_g2~~TRINITY_DN22828_c0_g2_i6.p2  ORF type:complete len:426 (-),score=79.04 TRINITY_DN22828_c0_g2_i6:202-1479(-)
MRSVQVQGKAARTLFRVPEEWEFVRHLGSGSYAAVAAFKDETGTLLAVKKVERVFDHSVLALRTLREVRLLSHFRHPNVLGLRRLLSDGEHFDDVYMCLEMMDGDLNQLIHAGKEKLTDYQVQCVLYQVLRGLLCLRRAHVIHRDLKPGNILLKAGGDVKIADLGLARTIDADDDTGTDCALTEYVVTRFYRAPEVVLTATRYTYAVDIWSMGCILGEMLTRQPLFEGKDALDQIRKIVSVCGTPSFEDMGWIPRSSPSWKFVERCSKQSGNGEDLQRLLRQPGTNPLAVELLEHMLRFDPSKRISVEYALVHRYVDAFRACEDVEVARARAVAPMDWSFDRTLCFDDEGNPKPFDKSSFRQAFLDTAELTPPERPGSGGSSPARSPNRRQKAAPKVASEFVSAAPIAAADSPPKPRRAATPPVH